MSFVFPYNAISKESINYLINTLSENGIDYSESIVREILLFEIGIDSFELKDGFLLNNCQKEKIEKDFCELLSFKPVQYITNVAPFFGHDFYVDERVLIPRFDTELIVEEALKVLYPGDHVIDICSGSGCIGISLAYEKPIDISFLDISEKAKEVLDINYDRILRNTDSYINRECQFYRTDILTEPVPVGTQSMDVVVSNPPYIAKEAVGHLDRNVLEEPLLALCGGEDGLDFYRPIAKEAFRILKKNGYVFLECGIGQSEEISDILSGSGFVETEVIKDYNGINRLVKSKKGE